MKAGTDLREYLKSLQGKKVVWGESDCTMFGAKWIEKARGVELDLPKFNTKFGALRLIAKYRGLVNLADEYLYKNRIFACQKIFGEYGPKKGDVAVIQTDDYGQIGSIYLIDNIYAVRSADAVQFMRPSPKGILKVWSV